MYVSSVDTLSVHDDSSPISAGLIDVIGPDIALNFLRLNGQKSNL